MNPMMAKPIAVAVDLLELFSVRFRAPFDQPKRVLRELPQRLHCRNNLIHFKGVFDEKCELN